MRSPLRHSLDILEEEIREIVAERPPEERVAFYEVLEMIRRIRRDEEAMLREMRDDPPGTTYAPREGKA